MKSEVLFNQVSQRLLDWSEHLSSWIDKSGLSVHIIRYEDMINNPIQTFRAALNYLKIDHSKSELLRAIEFSRFEKLAEQEKMSGFREKPIKSKQFFRQGKEDTWKLSGLDEKLIRAHYLRHKKMMKRFRYSINI